MPSDWPILGLYLFGNSNEHLDSGYSGAQMFSSFSAAAVWAALCNVLGHQLRDRGFSQRP